MQDTLLRTKLFVPPLRPNLVPRPHLIERLNQGLQLGHKLTLISAPAGFGKTTLAADWIAGCQCPAAWLSLDEGDNDPARFLTYLVTTLQNIVPGIGEDVLAMLQSPQPPPTEAVLTTLLNDVTTIKDKFIFALDDYHHIDSQPVDKALTFLLEHMPAQMHLLITTREDPNLPLSRLRVGGQLTELRVTDLRFNFSEAAAFLNKVMGLCLSEEEIAALEVRTEGWIAGLQMAALSMQGRADTATFIQAFTGGHHFVLDYLVEEVLQRQPEHVRSFLLRTTILERLSGPLCDALTGQDDGKRMLETLEKDNLFVVPLDDHRHWYRYHHLFADVLYAHLMEKNPDQAPILHQRASEWYEHNDSPSDAIRHAVAAEDFERAADLVELAWPSMDWSFQSDMWLGWVKALPDELIRARPVLSVGYAWSLLNVGELEAAEARLRDAERWLNSVADVSKGPEDGPVGMVVVDQEQFHSLPGTIAAARTYHAQAVGDVSGSVTYARQALDLLPEDHHLERGRLTVLLGIAEWTSGELVAAHRSFADAMASFQLAGNILFATSFTFILADIKIAQGRLHEAAAMYERSLKLVTERSEPVHQGTAMLYLGLSELHREQGNLETASHQLQKSEELGEQTDVYQYRLCCAQARIKKAQGDLNGALDLLDEAERWLFYRNPMPELRPVGALKTQVWVAQDRSSEALGWVRERGLSIDDDLNYLHEFEYITLAKVLIAHFKGDREENTIHEVLRLIERLLKAAQEGGRNGSVIEILVLQALAHQAQGDIPSALVSLERALMLAEPEDYVRIFIDEGSSMVALLREAAKAGIAPTYINRLQAALGEVESTVPVIQHLIDTLSERELEVLRLLGTELSGPEIARELMVSPNTMRTHTRNIYSKLGVHNRRTAVRRAEELNLL